MSLEELIEQCKKEDPKAQKALYKRFAPMLLGICIKYCKDKAIAEDLFQESFIVIFTKIHQFGHKGSFEGWIKRITINTILAYFKKRTFFTPTKEEDLKDPIDEVSINEETPSLDELLSYVKALPTQYRLVFNLYVLDEYSHKEISEKLGVSIGTSKSNLSRARVLLQKKLRENFYKIPNAVVK